MKNIFLKIVVCTSLLLASGQLSAQYPDIPKNIQAWSDSLMKAALRHSELAWAKAYQIIQEEAKHGRPYIPWAARPVDLPQAEIPAFPGAEGGGKFTAGGRGGKVLVVTSLAD